MAWLLREQRFQVGVVAFGAAIVLGSLASRVGGWAVMTDELLYERLALSIAQTGSPVPSLHGEHVDVYAQLYPLLIAPVFALVPMPSAVIVAHGWNGILFASASIPAYLLARRLVPAWMSVATAIASVALPWSVISGFLMTEAAAYPAFVWAVFAIHRAVAAPTPRRELLAVGTIVAAVLARPELATLAAVYPVTALVHDLRFGYRFRARRVLLITVATTAVVMVVAALAGSLDSLLGSYAPTLENGSLLSRAALRSAAVHVDTVGVALAAIPLLLGGGWALETTVHARVNAETYAFAMLVVTAVTLLTLEVGSFVERFGIGIAVKDRYLFYISPLLVLAAAVALASQRAPVLGLLSVTALVVATVHWNSFGPVLGVNVDSPASAANEPVTRLAVGLGISAPTLVAVVFAVVAVVLVVATRVFPTGAVAVVVLVGTMSVVGVETAYTWRRLLPSSSLNGPLPQRPADEFSWVDRSVPPRADVGMLAYSVGQDWFPSAVAWWNVEFWNARVNSAYLVGDWFTYTPEPFPRPRLRVAAGGNLLGDPPPYLIRTTLDARFAPAGARVGSAPYLEVVRLKQPPRAAWMTRGLTQDGWTQPGKGAVLRVFGTGAIRVRMTLSAPQVTTPRGYEVGGARGSLGSSGYADVSIHTCAYGHVDIPIHTQGATPVRSIATAPPYADDFRFVGLRVSQIATTPTSGRCTHTRGAAK
jgi:hypothetical protein